MQTSKKSGEENVRKLSKMGGGASYGITLPIEIIRKFGWREKQKVVIKKRGKSFNVSDWKNNPRQTLKPNKQKGKGGQGGREFFVLVGFS